MTPYEILGITPNADSDTIKKAYRKLVKQYHPDTNPDDVNALKKFYEIQNAYDKLTNPQPAPRQDGGWNPFQNTNFVRMQMVETIIHLTVEEAYTGCSKTVVVNSNIGQRIELEITCPPFTVSGMSHQIEIPTNQDNVKFILTVIFVVQESDKFRLDGATLFTVLEVDLASMILGTEVEVKTLDGPRFFTVVPGSQTDTKFVLSDLGFMNPNTGKRDDLIVTVKVKLPKELNAAQRAAIEAFRNASK